MSNRYGRSVAVLVIVGLSALSASAPARADGTDWLAYRGPGHDGISTETDWQADWGQGGPRILWKASVDTGFSSVTVAGGRVYTMGNKGGKDIVHCLDAASGKKRWQHAYPCPLDPKLYEGGPNATPTVDGNRVYTFSKQGQVFCLDAARGTVVWKKELKRDPGVAIPKWGLSGSALVLGEKVILNAGKAGVALDKNSGAMLWKTGNDAAGYATPVPFERDGRTLLAMFGAKALYAVDAGSGKIVWRFPWETSYDVNAASPIVLGDLIFISSGYNHGCAMLRMGRGEPAVVWQNKRMRNQFNSSVVYKGYVYGVDDRVLRCLDAGDGTEMWVQRGLGKGSLTLAGGRLIVLGEKGELVIAPASPKAFAPTARARVLRGKCWTAPVLSGGRIFCRNATGDLVCVDVRKK